MERGSWIDIVDGSGLQEVAPFVCVEGVQTYQMSTEIWLEKFRTA